MQPDKAADAARVVTTPRTFFLTFNSFYQQNLEVRTKVLTICAAHRRGRLVAPAPSPVNRRARRLGSRRSHARRRALLDVLGAERPCALVVSQRMKETVLCVNSGLPGMSNPRRTRTRPTASIANVR